MGGHLLDINSEKSQSKSGIDTRITTIFRQQESIIPNGDTIIESGDESFIYSGTPSY